MKASQSTKKSTKKKPLASDDSLSPQGAALLSDIQATISEVKARRAAYAATVLPRIEETEREELSRDTSGTRDEKELTEARAGLDANLAEITEKLLTIRDMRDRERQIAGALEEEFEDGLDELIAAVTPRAKK